MSSSLRATIHTDSDDANNLIAHMAQVPNPRKQRTLVIEAIGTPREAFMLQHRGKALLADGHITEAYSDFTRAVELRTDGDPTLLASAAQALDHTQQALQRGENKD